MTPKELGYNKSLEAYRKENNLDSFESGRIILEHKERYVVKSPDNEYDAELLGNLRFTAESRYDLPAVGDWVAFSEYDEGKALIHAIYPRSSILERKAVGKKGQIQIIATNIDVGLIVQAVDRDFNINRLERYLTICNAAKIDAIIVLNKIDLLEEKALAEIRDQLEQRIRDIPIIEVSMHREDGYTKLASLIENGTTYCLLGSSGAGKSTILNALAGEELMKTAEISDHVNKGRHTTSHRELIVLGSGGILIDNPGMREIGITDLSEGLETTFEELIAYAEDCRYKDCTHMHEEGCAILEAVENGEIDRNSYLNFRKMEKERMHFESDALEHKKKDKDLGKVIKEFKKQKKDNKF